MTPSLASFLAALLISQGYRKYAKANALLVQERHFTITMYFSIALFSAGLVFHAADILKWVWHLFLLLLAYSCFQQKELRTQRMRIWAFVPLMVISLTSDLTAVISHPFYEKWAGYIDNATSIAFFWMAAILLMQNRQAKSAEKDRIKKQQEDELNKAIAIRKVELEVLVAERTAELTKQKEELENALTELQATQKQLIQSEKMASLGELTAGIAHEIQNPLNFVNNFSEINTELIEEMKAELQAGNNQAAVAIANDIAANEEKINHHGKRADGIVKGMLQHSRSSNGIKEPTSINSLADEYLRLAYHGLRAKDKSFNATMKTDYDETIGNINIIPQDIGRVILNLIINAFYAVSEKKKLNIEGYEPTVSVGTSRSSSAADGRVVVQIKVKDNGNGIPQKVLDKIFQPFFTTKPTGQGTGLGLSMSYDIVTKGHGGEIKVETTEGAGLPGEESGTEFIINLPV